MLKHCVIEELKYMLRKKINMDANEQIECFINHIKNDMRTDIIKIDRQYFGYDHIPGESNYGPFLNIEIGKIYYEHGRYVLYYNNEIGGWRSNDNFYKLLNENMKEIERRKYMLIKQKNKKKKIGWVKRLINYFSNVGSKKGS